jgi:3-methylcrotonyl-CoA carboxylase alpha subunit
MEMNTRLQVEHPVTEAITGQDLVEWQLRVASGEPLPLRQEELRIQGHAIEARICAENPDKNFLPATGTLQVYRKPAGVSFERGVVRIDDGVNQGDVISPYYDSMVAKLIVHGQTRAQALARLDAALSEMHIVGLSTNVQFLRHVTRSPSFADANLDTALIERERAVLFEQDPIGLPFAVASLVAHLLMSQQAASSDPWDARDGWQAWGEGRRVLDVIYLGQAHEVVLTYGRNALTLQVGSVTGSLQVQAGADGWDVDFAGQRHRVHVVMSGETAHIFAPHGAAQIQHVDALSHAAGQPEVGGRLTAPMPGKVVSFAVKAGDAVKQGQALAVMEAMKMEHTLVAPVDGVVAELHYQPGDQVAEGAALLKLEASE